MSQTSENLNPSIDFAFVSDIGMRRLNNQDSHLELVQETTEVWRSRGHLFVVADGMGAHAAGELASKMAVEGVSHHYCQHRQLSPPEAILKAVREANSEIHQRGQANSEFHNMGTTCSSLLLLPQGALVAHVGDSRVYRLRGTRFQQLTFDHSLVWEMQATGQIEDTDAAINIPKNVITRSLGPQAQVQVDLEGPFVIQLGDTFMLCSDGLTGKIRDDELGLILGLLPPNEATAFCADLANLRGGPDNITMTVAKVVGDEMTGRHRRCEPLTVGAELTPERHVHVGVWVLMAVSWIVAAGLVVSTFYWLALAAFLVGAVAIPVAIWQSHGGSGGIALVGGRRLGRGPYVTLDCPVTAEQMERLYDGVRGNFRQYGDTLVVDRSRLAACLTEARTRSAQGEHREGIRMLAVAVSVVANALKASRDSSSR
ncbi:MAG: serine/threonine-protein phosphatase [Planctomycetaceae bacterium]|nr:serine/threonine-protein phosphatase [Planctomycetaceae bacterium]